jgi:drug/metabolite transporter (DMT)-like permease
MAQRYVSFLLAIVSFIWAGSFVAVRIIVQEISAYHIGFLRFLIATPIMVLYLFFSRDKPFFPLNKLPHFLLLGVTGVTFLYIFQILGIEYTNASTSGVLINLNVIFISILSAIFLKEHFTRKKTIGIFLSFSGAFLIFYAQMNNEAILFTTLFFIGCMLVILSALCWAIYSIVGKTLLKTYDLIVVTTYSFVFGTLFYVPFVVPDIFIEIQTISINSWIAILYLALGCSVFGYVAWYHALSKNEAGKSAVFLNLIPLFTILLSFFIGEYPTVSFILGATLIIYGVYLTQKN